MANHLHGALRKSAIAIITAAIQAQDDPSIFPDAEFCLGVWLGDRQGEVSNWALRLQIIELVERALREALAP